MRQFEFVTVCVDYADFLAFTLPVLLQHFDRGVVVTSSKDERTQNIVRYYNPDQVQLVVTDEMYADGAKFNKGKAINAGLAVLRKDSWVVHIDADVMLTPHVGQVLRARHLDPHCVYGLDRQMCKSFESWLDFVQNPSPVNEKYYLVHHNHFTSGARLAHYNNADGWMPIGFFQLWHPRGSGVDSYPEVCPGADHSDIVFAKKFPLGRRHFIAETVVFHLESEAAYSGINWQGRRTKEFRPHVPEPIVQYINLPCPECPPTADNRNLEEKLDSMKPLLERIRQAQQDKEGYQPPANPPTWFDKLTSWYQDFRTRFL